MLYTLRRHSGGREAAIRNLEIPGACGGCHRAALSADPLARPGMTVKNPESPMSTVGLMLLFLGALASGFVAGLAGFGTALMALGIWIYVLPPSIAVPLVLICSVVAQTSTLPSLCRSFDLSLVWPFLIGGLAGVPLGTMLVPHAVPGMFKLI